MDALTAEPPTIAARKPLFTRENAAEMARRSAVAKARNKQAIKDHVAQLEAEAAKVRPLIDTTIAKAVADADLPDDEQYRFQRLTRTRAQLEQLDKQLAAARDPKDVKAISDAIGRLSELERILAGRPLPGSRRPPKDKPKLARNSYEPIE